MVTLAINLSLSRVSYKTGNVILTFTYNVAWNLGYKENSAQDEKITKFARLNNHHKEENIEHTCVFSSSIYKLYVA